MSEPVDAVRAKPGEFFLAAEAIELGMRFRAEGTTYEVVGRPVTIGTLMFMATVRILQGESAGKELQAMLRAGRKVDG